MKVNFNDIAAYLQLYSSIKDRDFEFSTGYKLAKLKRIYETEGEFFSSKMQSIIEQYGLRDSEGKLQYNEDGTGVKIQDEFIEECSKKLQSLNEIEIDVEDVYFEEHELIHARLRLEEIEILVPYIKKETLN